MLKMLQMLYQFLVTKLCRTFMITLWTVNRFEKLSNICTPLLTNPTPNLRVTAGGARGFFT